MTDAAKSPAVPAAPLAPAEAEKLARAEAYLKLEDFVARQKQSLAKRLADEEEKLFRDLAALPDPTANTRAADLLRTYAGLIAQLSSDRKNLEGFALLLETRMRQLYNDKSNMLRYALEKRIKVLSETHTKEQKEADAVQREIKVVQERLAGLGRLGGTVRKSGTRRTARKAKAGKS
jgi:paraquat-inducible protein B